MAARPIAIVVDDSKPFLMYLSILLNRMNIEVLPVNNAAEAMEIARVTQPQLMTMDMVMPEMDGLTALRSMRQDEELALIPVIMISSYQNKSNQWEAMSLGCIDVLDKPLDLRRLHKAIQNCDLYPGGRRRYMRASFEAMVKVRSQGGTHDVASISLSERGILVRTNKPLPKDAVVEVEIPLLSGEILQVGGKVIYAKAQSGSDSMILPGAAIKFDRLTAKDLEALSQQVAELLIGDILEEQTEPVVKPH